MVVSLLAITLLAILACHVIHEAGAQSIAELTAAAKKGGPEAAFKLAAAYEKQYDFENAIKWYKTAARGNYAPAQLALGFCYANGQGVKEDWKEAASWYRKAADQGLVEAQFRLAVCYERGLGVPKNPNDALTWYEKAANNGLVDAQFAAGELHYANKNYAAAFNWYLKAANRGLPDAQHRVAIAFLIGQGAARDLVEGGKWLVLASMGGREDPAKLHEKLSTIYRLTPEQIAESIKRAKEFKPQ